MRSLYLLSLFLVSGISSAQEDGEESLNLINALITNEKHIFVLPRNDEDEQEDDEGYNDNSPSNRRTKSHFSDITSRITKISNKHQEENDELSDNKVKQNTETSTTVDPDSSFLEINSVVTQNPEGNENLETITLTEAITSFYYSVEYVTVPAIQSTAASISIDEPTVTTSSIESTSTSLLASSESNVEPSLDLESLNSTSELEPTHLINNVGGSYLSSNALTELSSIPFNSAPTPNNDGLSLITSITDMTRDDASVSPLLSSSTIETFYTTVDIQAHLASNATIELQPTTLPKKESDISSTPYALMVNTTQDSTILLSSSVSKLLPLSTESTVSLASESEINSVYNYTIEPATRHILDVTSVSTSELETTLDMYTYTELDTEVITKSKIIEVTSETAHTIVSSSLFANETSTSDATLTSTAILALPMNLTQTLTNSSTTESILELLSSESITVSSQFTTAPTSLFTDLVTDDPLPRTTESIVESIWPGSIYTIILTSDSAAVQSFINSSSVESFYDSQSILTLPEFSKPYLAEDFKSNVTTNLTSYIPSSTAALATPQSSPTFLIPTSIDKINSTISTAENAGTLPLNATELSSSPTIIISIKTINFPNSMKAVTSTSTYNALTNTSRSTESRSSFDSGHIGNAMSGSNASILALITSPGTISASFKSQAYSTTQYVEKSIRPKTTTSIKYTSKMNSPFFAAKNSTFYMKLSSNANIIIEISSINSSCNTSNMVAHAITMSSSQESITDIQSTMANTSDINSTLSVKDSSTINSDEQPMLNSLVEFDLDAFNMSLTQRTTSSVLPTSTSISEIISILDNSLSDTKSLNFADITLINSPPNMESNLVSLHGVIPSIFASLTTNNSVATIASSASSSIKRKSSSAFTNSPLDTQFSNTELLEPTKSQVHIPISTFEMSNLCTGTNTGFSVYSEPSAIPSYTENKFSIDSTTATSLTYQHIDATQAAITMSYRPYKASQTSIALEQTDGAISLRRYSPTLIIAALIAAVV